MNTARVFWQREDGAGYEFKDFACTAHIEEGEAMEDAGVCRRCRGSIRLMTGEKLDIRPGDYVALNIKEKSPDRDRDYRITGIRDNRRGTRPHWRLTINGGI